MTPELQTLIETLRAASSGLLLVVTGAGVSLASGIPTFRGTDRDAVWKRDVMELGTVDYFNRDPAGSWRWYLSRFDSVLQAKPNPAHLALAALERWQLGRGGRFLLVTQNVDTLHEQAGSRELVKVHGSADRVRCSAVGCELGAPDGWLPRRDVDMGTFLADPKLETVPRCPRCGELLRQHVLWFDELYEGHADYQFRRVRRSAGAADALLFVGTSFSVGITELLLDAARRRGIPALSIDPGEASAAPGVVKLKAPAESLLPDACAALGAAMEALRTA